MTCSLTGEDLADRSELVEATAAGTEPVDATEADQGDLVMDEIGGSRIGGGQEQELRQGDLELDDCPTGKDRTSQST